MLRVIDDIHLSEIGNALRETLGEGNQFPPKDMGEAIKYSNEAAFSNGYGSGFEEGEEFGYNTGFADGDELGYQAGLEQGYNSGKTDGIEEGKKAEQDEFWDTFQSNGNRTNYTYAFSYGQMKDNIYNPKYDVKGDLMGAYNQTSVTDTKVKLLNVTNLYQAFRWSQIRRIVELNISESTSNLSVGAFEYANYLTDLTMTGILASSVSFGYSPLSVASIKSIISCMKDFSGTANEYKYTITFKTSAFEALEAEGTTAEYNGVTCTWAELIGFKKWNLTKA